MPVDMQRPPKIPVGRTAPGEVERIEIESLEDGTYVVTCINRGGEGDMGRPHRSTFSDVDSLQGYIADKLGGGAAAGAMVGAMDEALGGQAARRAGAIGESKRRPTRPAGEQAAPAYAETQTDVEPEY